VGASRAIAAMLMTALCGVLAVAVAPAARAARAAPANLEQVVLTAGPSAAALELKLTAPAAARVFRLHAPERVVIDLRRTRQRVHLPSAPPGSVVTSLRAGVRAHGGLRLVLQLKDTPALQLSHHAAAGGRELRVELSTTRSARARRTPAHPSSQRAQPLTAAAHAAAVGLRASPTELPRRGIRAAHAPAGHREVIVAVDAGHGGVDPGATGPDGTHEKDITLAIARALAARIDRAPGMHAVLTRDGDYFVALRDRMVKAHAAHADLFVSIHADSVRDRTVSGGSVYILSERGASSEAARRLADQENAADLKGGISLAKQAPDLRSVLLDLSQSASIGESGIAAKDVLGALDGIETMRKSEVQHAAFVVLKSPDLPSMLVETAYISNPADERRLRSPKQQKRLADAIFAGIADYFRQFPPQGSLFARAHAAAASDASS